MAAKIKESLGNVYALLISFKDCENDMREAASREDYADASRLKSERDTKRDAAMKALLDVEEMFLGKGNNDLSISTIKDESFMSHRSAHSALQFDGRDHLEKGNIIKSHTEIETRTMEHQGMDQDSCEEDDDDGDSSNGHSEHHPLEGIEGAEDLPAPEEVNNEDGSISPDFLHKVENLVGNYRAKCFFSKNWVLREAALSKISLIAPDICDESCGENCAEVICNIILRSIDDKNQQVYLAGLILLDDSMAQFEIIGLSQNKMTQLLAKIVVNLLAKLADSKQKVVESAELSLLSLAHSCCVDISYMSSAATKRIRSEGAKGGRALSPRLHFIENLVAEFGCDVPWERAVEFAKSSKAFEHKGE